MSGIMIIGKRELRTFFTSPTFYIIAFLMTAIMSWLYPITLSMFAQQAQSGMMQPGMNTQMMNIHYGVFLRHLSYLNLIMIFVVPALTMKLIAEEKKLKTFDLLLTSPVTSMDIVVGKYLSALGGIFGITLISLLYPLATRAVAENIPWAPLIIAFFGIFMLAAVYAAMDLFCSSLTEQSLIAFVMSVILNISVWFISAGVDMTDSQTVRTVLEHISLNTHLAGMVEGTLRTSGLIFLFSLIAFFLFLAERVVESSRWRS